jgi:hypothetical protein
MEEMRMRDDFDELSPVAIAIDDIVVADSVRLSGIDLDTGHRASVLIERSVGPQIVSHTAPRHDGSLVLTISIEHVTTRR